MTVTQGLRLQLLANGVCFGNRFFPYKTYLFDTTGQELTIKNKRIYLKSAFVILSNSEAVGVLGTERLTTMVDGKLTTIVEVSYPSITNSYQFADIALGLLTDYGVTLTWTFGPGAWTYNKLLLVYAEVDDS